ncbi:hypothetical protein EDD86DRAFT_203746 [Gorgonomyces haynaldii]|nr:hypothetical protein EDD86DRAFT_203746 [Gorgonomyces haynaldii]
MGKDYYNILGISKSADEEEIKKAYRKQALKWHPDRNTDKEKADKMFKQVSEAYEVLSDKNKRQIYDQFGEEGLKGQGMPGGNPFAGGGMPRGFSFNGSPFTPSNADDIFKQFFSSSGLGDDLGGIFGAFQNGARGMHGQQSRGFGGMPGGFGGMPGGFGGMPGAQFGQQSAPSVVQRQLPVALEDLYKGTEKRLKVTKKLYDATGRYTNAEKILTINIKPGWKAGTKIKFAGEGDELPNGGAQDMEFVIEEKPHSVFTRDGNDLKTSVQVSLVDALCGFQKTITHLDGTPLTVQSGMNEPCQPGSVIYVKGKGMPISKQPGTFGDLLVTVNVQLPKRLSEDQKAQAKRLFSVL